MICKHELQNNSQTSSASTDQQSTKRVRKVVVVVVNPSSSFSVLTPSLHRESTPFVLYNGIGENTRKLQLNLKRSDMIFPFSLSLPSNESIIGISSNSSSRSTRNRPNRIDLICLCGLPLSLPSTRTSSAPLLFPPLYGHAITIIISQRRKKKKCKTKNAPANCVQI